MREVLFGVCEYIYRDVIAGWSRGWSRGGLTGTSAMKKLLRLKRYVNAVESFGLRDIVNDTHRLTSPGQLQFHATDTDTDTDIRDALSCNFVNVYTISYRVQYTCTRAHP